MAQADIAIACAGGLSAETADRPSLELDQHAFLSELAKLSRGARVGTPGNLAPAPPPLVFVTFSPGSIIAPWAEAASGYLNMFLSGSQTGNAAADLLLGIVGGFEPVTRQPAHRPERRIVSGLVQQPHVTSAMDADEPHVTSATDADEPHATLATDADEPHVTLAMDADEPAIQDIRSRLISVAHIGRPKQPFRATARHILHRWLPHD